MVIPAAPALAQTKLKLSAIKPGTERVQLIYNGDFQFQGPLFGTNYPSPTGWSGFGEIYANAGSNMVAYNSGIICRAQVESSAPVSLLQQTITLEPATSYVFSGYLWNMGDSANHVNVNIDMNDAFNEPQITLAYTDPQAAEGYFVYRRFTTSDTGTNVTVRVFYDGFTGTGTAPAYYPLTAQWDNIAITKLVDFAAPQPSASAATLRPQVRITSPANGGYAYASDGTVTINADATDLDGTVTNVQFFAGATMVGASAASPWTAVWSNAAFGSYVLTAVAADNTGATTASAPVTLTVTGPPPGLGEPDVDATTMSDKLLMGYQGWFACPKDGSAGSQWIHWFRNQTPIAANATVDFWPDVSELDGDELFATSMTYSNSAPARLYSAYNSKTVLRHFKWMRDNRLDGVFLQRFVPGPSDTSGFARLNKVANNVRTGADTYQRVYAIMYDISGQPASTLVSTLTNDWSYLVNVLQITNSSRYLRHNGKPVIAVWGFGFTDRPGTPQQAQEVINFFKNAGLTVLGGVPTYWRTLINDSQSDPAWAAVYRSFDIISPWSVGRYSTTSDADSFRVNLIVPDLAEAMANGCGYMPVIFPGFSWHNLNGGPLNQIPRNGGTFYWRQAYNAILSGCTMIYGAMFDEMDEGTAMLKMAPTAAELPAQGSFVPLNIDGTDLPSDWYLRLANEAGKMLRGETPLQTAMPLVITVQPLSRTNLCGSTATFSTQALGPPPVTYQWQKDGTNLSDAGNLSGATSPTLTLSSVRLTDAGSYTVIITNLSGNVTSSVAVLTVPNQPPVIAPITSQTNDELVLFSLLVNATDNDVPAQTLTYALTNSPAGATIDGSGLITWTPTEAQGPLTTNITVLVTDNGTPNLTASFTFQIVVREVNLAPVLMLPPDTNIDELAPFTATATATDADLPVNQLTFALVSGPTGLTVSPDGVINWTPSEAQGPSSNIVFISVMDCNPQAGSATSLSVTSSFQIVVNEVNAAPVFMQNTNIDELVPFTAIAATDPDIPANPLTFTLLSGPSGLTLSTNGVINWTPDESQGPSTNIVTISVTDTNPAAVNATSLSATSSIQIIVREVNVAPILGPLSDRTVNPGQMISFTVSATDADLPTNTLTFSLISPPSGANINSDSGLFGWRPTTAQADTTNLIQVRVQDNGSPSLDDINSFNVIVNPLTPVLLTASDYTNGQFHLLISGPTGPDYIIMGALTLTNWTDIATNLSPATPFEFNDTNLGFLTNRFYRVRLTP
jgi:hypothetical protein